jgi:hypothetical protein
VIESAGASATRRTFAVRLHRKGYDLRHLREVLGLSTLSATKALCEGDPVDLGRIVARVEGLGLRPTRPDAGMPAPPRAPQLPS